MIALSAPIDLNYSKLNYTAMKHFNLLKTLLLLCALIVGGLSGWADSYTITFAKNSGDGTAVSTSTACSSIVSGGASYLDGNAADVSKVYYGGSDGLKLGASSSAGSIKMNLSSPITPTSIVVNAKLYNSSKPTTLKVNGSTAQSVSSSFSDLTFEISSEISFIKLESSKYCWISSVTVNYTTASVNSLSVKTAPTKTRYEVGETLDMSGFVLDADGAEISAGYSMSIDATPITNGATLSSAGKKLITVSYGGKEVTQNISVGTVTSIAITTPPTKTSYDTGDSFDATGMVVTASLSTGEVSEPDTWTREVTGYTVDLDDNLVPANTAATITYASKTTTQPITVTDVAVSDVSLKTSTTIEKGKTETLTPTFTPANATNKNVTWESDNTSVATVEDGVVTAVAAGTATITVTTEDGDKTATCEVIVVNQKGGKDAPYTVAEIKNDKASGTGIYVEGYIVGNYNSKEPVNPATVDTNLALADKANETQGSNTIPVELPKGSLRTNWGPHSNNLIGYKVLIKGNKDTYFSTNGIKNVTEISAVSVPVSITAAGFATYAGDFGLDFSGLDVKVYKARVNGTTITFDKVTEVPAGEGVLLQGEGTFDVPVKSVDAWAADDNAFVRGTGAAVATGDGPYNYILNKVNGVVGFYKANGQTVAKNRAYLQSTTAAARISLNFDEETTGISEVVKSDVNNKVFDLQGRHIVQPTKGLYIMNGRKVLVK